jgi:hypothetical protein
VTTNQIASRIAVMARFFRQYSWCFAVSCIELLLEKIMGGKKSRPPRTILFLNCFSGDY